MSITSTTTATDMSAMNPLVLQRLAFAIAPDESNLRTSYEANVGNELDQNCYRIIHVSCGLFGTTRTSVLQILIRSINDAPESEMGAPVPKS